MARKTYKKKSLKKTIEKAPIDDAIHDDIQNGKIEAAIAATEEVETNMPVVEETPPPAPKPKPAPVTDLSRGSKGDEVAKVQAAVGVAQTGDFDFGTVSAVKKWQKVNGLTADGVVGPKTRAKML